MDELLDDEIDWLTGKYTYARDRLRGAHRKRSERRPGRTAIKTWQTLRANRKSMERVDTNVMVS